jgi:predicted metal-dependent phosphoesterase TrpH
MLIDLHTHTYPISWDSALTPDQMIELEKKAGVDGVCFTEHDYFWDPAECEALSKKHNFLVLAGIEANTEYGHMLAYGLHKYKFGMHRVEQLAAMVKAAGGAMIAAHPYRRYMQWYELSGDEMKRSLEKAAKNVAYKHCIALETLHGRAGPQQNDFSERLRQKLRMRGTGGSDAHQPHQVGRCVTRFERDVTTLTELIAELRAGRFEPVDLRPADEVDIRIPSV